MLTSASALRKALITREFSDLYRFLVPVYFGVWGLSLLSGVLFGAVNIVLSHNAGAEFLRIGAESFLVAGIIGIIGAPLFTFITVLWRYYRNFFGDEGYLTFTLPVSESDHLLAKTVSGVVWQLLGVFTALISAITLALSIGMFDLETTRRVVGELLPELQQFFASLDVPLIIFGTLSALMGEVLSTGVWYLAITTGAMLAQKHKILASVGLYYAYNTAIGMVTGLLGLVGMAEESLLGSYTLTSVILLVLECVAVVGIFFLNRYFLKNKLNLS